jgi:hypothetical protein
LTSKGHSTWRRRLRGNCEQAGRRGGEGGGAE